MAPGTFQLKPALPFRLDLTVWTLRRRPGNIVDRWDGTTYCRVLSLPTGPVDVSVTQAASPAAHLRVTVAGQPINAAVQTAVTSTLERLLGLRIGLQEFYQFASHDRRLRPLAQRFQGMKPPRFATVFEGLINAIACQQLSLTVGIELLSRLAATCGAAFGEGAAAVHSFPSPVDLAGRSLSELRQLGFSGQKSRAIIELSRSVAEGRLDLEGLAKLSDDEAAQRLAELRGVGRWTAEYVLLRGLGRTHIFPGDDVGARNNLQRWLGLNKPLDYERVREVLCGWGDFAGLLYFHLLLDRLVEIGNLGAIGSPTPHAEAVVAGTS
jgi:DNA-3-methyladenine glycosylase II